MPRSPIALLLTLVLLTGGAVAAAVLGGSSTSAQAAFPVSAAHVGGSGGHGHAAGAHAWEGGAGTVPTLQDALLTLERRGSILIREDSQFNPANGVRSGSGTFDDPFVISGWFVDVILIADTTLAYEIKENYVGQILILDWTGTGGYIHHNHLANLRTNRNVERVGDPTAAVIENNTIGRVQELRHFDGELRHNVIGREDQLPLLQNGIALNIAGLNGAGIHDNTIHGGVDMKIHGHHHSDGLGAHSHNHGQPDEAQQDGRHEEHGVRHVDFRFYRNRIVDDGFGLRYNDLNHAGDDRQATSEQEPALELPHVHHTTITIEDNVIEGATLRVVVLNSADERHLPGQTALLRVLGNRILKPTAGDGLVVQDVRDAAIEIRGNTVEKGDLNLAGTSAIFLQRFANTTVTVDGNRLGDYRYGVRAHDFDANTTWSVGTNPGPSKQPVYWDDSVANAPGAPRSEAQHAHEEEGEGHEGHGHGAGDTSKARGARREPLLDLLSAA